MPHDRKAAAKRRRLAATIMNRICDFLLMNVNGDRAERLQLRDKNERDLGGLARFVVVDKVLEIVTEELKAVSEKE